MPNRLRLDIISRYGVWIKVKFFVTICNFHVAIICKIKRKKMKNVKNAEAKLLLWLLLSGLMPEWKVFIIVTINLINLQFTIFLYSKIKMIKKSVRLFQFVLVHRISNFNLTLDIPEGTIYLHLFYFLTICIGGAIAFSSSDNFISYPHTQHHLRPTLLLSIPR